MQLSKGQVAVITGAASGIGRSLAHAAADRGLKLVLADRDEPGLDLATADLLAAGADAVAVPTDVRDPAAVDALRDAALDAYGTVHLVCNNAGVGGGGRVWDTSLEMWRWVLEVDLWSVIYGMRAFVPTLIAQGEGHVVNTASAAGLVSVGMLGPYVVAKHGVVALSETLDLELDGTGVGVSVLCPSFVRTRILDIERHFPADVVARRDSGTGAPGPDRELLGQLIDGGLDPDDVARQTFAAVEADRLYVITHPEVVERMKARLQRIIDDSSALG
jgi:NAD(P)-dependent dehydrogenase (short-subunit alcohol dehydrogenase family)